MTVDAWERGLAGQALLLSQPPYVRQGWTEVIRPANPAAGAAFTRKVPNDTWDRLLAVSFTLVTSAVNTFRAPAIAFADQDGAIITQAPATGTLLGQANVNAFGSFMSAQTAAQSIGRVNTGSVTSPGAAATIATISVAQGEWLVQWQVEVDGTTAVGDDNNFQLTAPGVAGNTSENGHTPGQPYPQPSETVLAPVGGGTVQVKSIAAGTVGAQYLAQITVSEASAPASYFEIPDLVMKSGWQHQIVIPGEDVGDQLSSIVLLVERYPSSVAAGIVP